MVVSDHGHEAALSGVPRVVPGSEHHSRGSRQSDSLLGELLKHRSLASVGRTIAGSRLGRARRLCDRLGDRARRELKEEIIHTLSTCRPSGGERAFEPARGLALASRHTIL